MLEVAFSKPAVEWTLPCYKTVRANDDYRSRTDQG